MQQSISPAAPVAIQEPEEAVDYKRVFFLLLKNWYWFVVCVGIALVCAYLFTHYYRQQTYSINTSILIDEDSKKTGIDNIFEKALMSRASYAAIGNEIELLKSYTLARRVFEKLNWRTSWYEKDLLKWNGLYASEPFIVRESETGNNMEGFTLFLKPGKDQSYTLSADGVGRVNNAPVKIKFQSRGKFGEPFKNDYFHFTLYRKDPDKKEEEGMTYCFRFNNPSNLAKVYMRKERIDRADKMNDVIVLSMEGAEPLREIHYLNGLVSEYIDQKLEFRSEINRRSLDFINAQLNGMSDSLTAAGNTVTNFRTNNQVVDIGAQGQMVMTQLSDIERERSQNQIQLEYFRNLLSYLDNTDSIKKVVMPSVVGIGDPSLNSTVVKLTDLYNRREVLSFSAYENSPTMVLLNREIRQLGTQLRENLVNLIDNSKLTIQSLKKREDDINRQLNNLPGKEQTLINITRQYNLTNEIYTFLLQKRAETEIAMASTVSDVQVIDPARVERIVPSGMAPRVYYMIALLVGLALPGIVILFADFMNNTIQLQEDVEKLTSLTIIGNVPHSSNASELVVTENPRAPITEAYRGIRTNLQYMLNQEGQKIIGVHSIQPGEGKTFSSTNLASILAVNDKKVLLIGADMRKPRLHHIFNITMEEGLSTYLIGQSKYEDIIAETGVKNLYLVSSGPVPPNPAELLERDQYRELITQARKDFDFIVIDNAPVSFVTDGLITGRQADLNIFILRYGVSRKDQLKFINEMSERGVMKHPALLINDIKLDRYGYGYHYYSYRYSYKNKYYYEDDGEERHHHHHHKKSLLDKFKLNTKARS